MGWNSSKPGWVNVRAVLTQVEIAAARSEILFSRQGTACCSNRIVRKASQREIYHLRFQTWTAISKHLKEDSCRKQENISVTLYLICILGCLSHAQPIALVSRMCLFCTQHWKCPKWDFSLFLRLRRYKLRKLFKQFWLFIPLAGRK